MKLSRIFEPTNYFPAYGDVILKPYPYNKKAVELFSMLTFDNQEEHEKVVRELIECNQATLVANEILIQFTVKNRCLRVTYTFQSELSVSDMYVYDSLFNNNDPDTELFLAVTKAVCNAQMAKKPNQIILYNYPATAMYLNPEESLPIKEKLRALLKLPLFHRFR
jgi:hypothetical protein